MLRVLVVDDNADTVETMAVLIRLWGHDVQTALSGNTALGIAVSFCPEVVFFDIAMAGMSGLDLAKKLRARVSKKPPLLVAISGFGDKNTRVETLAVGAHMHLVKPVSPDDLKGVLDRVLDEDVADDPAKAVLTSGSSRHET